MIFTLIQARYFCRILTTTVIFMTTFNCSVASCSSTWKRKSYNLNSDLHVAVADKVICGALFFSVSPWKTFPWVVQLVSVPTVMAYGIWKSPDLQKKKWCTNTCIGIFNAARWGLGVSKVTVRTFCVSSVLVPLHYYYTASKKSPTKMHIVQSNYCKCIWYTFSFFMKHLHEQCTPASSTNLIKST